ncbi:hypothetical protein EVAR_67488_1 [Eumeta japonica]|uniref:Uncharacterized protein n=1 Tax=Eumeta variegata TaxID=151549 RepID=A0A4C1ZF88_EUMVA|nr:hypothetical protein EVAR_67488_1 [Eumeta japonica]
MVTEERCVKGRSKSKKENRTRLLHAPTARSRRVPSPVPAPGAAAAATVVRVQTSLSLQRPCGSGGYEVVHESVVRRSAPSRVSSPEALWAHRQRLGDSLFPQTDQRDREWQQTSKIRIHF